MHNGVFLAVLLLLTSALVAPAAAYAVQLDADITGDTVEPKFRFLRVVSIEYPQGGELAEMLRGQSGQVLFELDSKNSDVSGMIGLLNESIESELSTAKVEDLHVSYKAILSGNENSATIEYKIDLEPEISGIGDEIVDFQWRGFSIDQPVVISTQDHGQYDINSPLSALRVIAPEVSSALEDTRASEILAIPLLDASGLRVPVSGWHYLFDPIGILISDMEIDTVVSQYSLGECTIRELTVCEDRIWTEKVTLDKEYTVRATESKDDATITLLGYTELESIQGVEYFRFAEGADTGKVEDDLSISMMYGMAAIAAVTAGGFFVYSNKKTKNERDMGQTGIDPSSLVTYSTSLSSGGYHTNRGESVLIGDTKKSAV